MPEEARLNVRLAYQNFGACAFEFRIEIDGWELSGEPVESGGLVDQDRVAVSDTGTLSLPLAQASTRKAEVAFSLRRALDRDASKIQLSLPVPLADSVATGELTVRTNTETELLPDLTGSTGLAASPAREASSPPNPDAGVELHFRSLLPNAVFAANRANRSREESAQITAQIDIAPDTVQLDQRLEYMVRYEPVKELILEITNDLPIDEEGVEVALLTPASGNSDLIEQRTPLRFEPVVDENEPTATGARRLRATLPQPRVGKFAVAVRYQISRPQSSVTGNALQVPLFSPVDAHVTSQLATVHAPRGMFVSLGQNADASSWKSSDPHQKKTSGNSGYEFATDRGEFMLPLIVSAADSNAPSTTIVDRVWLQTWLSGGREQDRAAFRLRTSNPQATVELPPEASTGEVEVLVDGRIAEVSGRAAGRIVVRLPRETSNGGDTATAEPTTHTLEIRFRQAIQQPLIARHRLVPPQIDGTTELSQIYWQIILPSDEHIVESPEQLVSASQWQWLGAFWGRRPVMSQVDLEKWVGASSQLAPTIAENQYLFTGLLPVSSIAIVTAPRWLVVLLASSSILILLAGWLYLPLRARPWMLVALSVVIAAMAITYPTAARLIAQAAAIGVVLAPVSMLISRLLSRPSRRQLAPSITSSSQRAMTPRSDSIAMPPVVAGASTSPTVSLRTSDSNR